MAELRSYERDRYVANNIPVRIVVDNIDMPENGQYMDLSVAQLKKGINSGSQQSIYNPGQTYDLIGYRWHPTGKEEEAFAIDYNVKSRLSDEWKKIMKEQQNKEKKEKDEQ